MCVARLLLLCCDPDSEDSMGFDARKHHRLVLLSLEGTVVTATHDVGEGARCGPVLSMARRPIAVIGSRRALRRTRGRPAESDCRAPGIIW